MDVRPQTPVDLKIVAVLFVIGGILALLDVLVSLSQGNININFGVLGILIGSGLLRFSRGWRTCALVSLWIAFAALLVFALLALRGARPTLKVFGQAMGDVPAGLALLVAAAAFALTLWEYRVLTRPDVVQLFDESDF